MQNRNNYLYENITSIYINWGTISILNPRSFLSHHFYPFVDKETP